MSPVMDLSDVVGSLATGTYAVTRRGAPTFVGGIEQGDGSVSTLMIPMSVQSVGPQMMDVLPEGTRIQDARTLFSAAPLLTAQENGGLADRVTIDGVMFQVQAIRDWQAEGSATMAIAKRVDP